MYEDWLEVHTSCQDGTWLQVELCAENNFGVRLNAAVELGRRGGASKSPAKQTAARLNGKKAWSKRNKQPDRMKTSPSSAIAKV